MLTFSHDVSGSRRPVRTRAALPECDAIRRNPALYAADHRCWRVVPRPVLELNQVNPRSDAFTDRTQEVAGSSPASSIPPAMPIDPVDFREIQQKQWNAAAVG